MWVYIIDGYNIIKTIPELDEVPLAHARDELIRLLEEFSSSLTRKGQKNKVILVFDGKDDVFVPSARKSAVQVVFTTQEKADDYIKRFVERRGGGSFKVVTNDREICSYARKCRAATLSVTDFIREIRTRQRRGDHKESRRLESREERAITEYVEEILSRKYEDKA